MPFEKARSTLFRSKSGIFYTLTSILLFSNLLEVCRTKLSSRSSNLSFREEKFESSADIFARGVGEAEVTTATIAVAASIADSVREALAIILKKQMFAALSFIL